MVNCHSRLFTVALIMISVSQAVLSAMTVRTSKGNGVIESDSACATAIENAIATIKADISSYNLKILIAQGSLDDAESTVNAMSFMVANPANMTDESCAAAKTLLDSWKLTSSDSAELMQMVSGMPMAMGQKFVNDIGTATAMPSDKLALVSDGLYADSDTISGTHTGWAGPTGTISSFRIMSLKQNEKLVIGYIHEQFSLTHALTEVDTPMSKTHCTHHWFFSKSCNTVHWIDVSYAQFTPTKEQHDALNNWLDCRMAQRFKATYSATIAMDAQKMEMYVAEIKAYNALIAQLTTQEIALQKQLASCGGAGSKL